MTSNVGAASITSAGSRLGFDSGEAVKDEASAYEKGKELVMDELRRTFRPEFLNRIDDIIVFHRLTQDNITEIARRMLKATEKRMAAMGVKLEADDAAVNELAKEGFDPKYGARPLRRAIQNKVEDVVAEQMLSGGLKSGDTAHLTFADDRLCVGK